MNVAVVELDARKPQRGLAHQPELMDDGVAHPLHLLEERRGRTDDLGEGVVEAPEQRLGDRLGVLAGNGAEQDELQQLVVVQRSRSGLGEAVPQPLPVPFVVRRRPLPRLLVLEEVRGNVGIPQSAAHGHPRSVSLRTFGMAVAAGPAGSR